MPQKTTIPSDLPDLCRWWAKNAYRLSADDRGALWAFLYRLWERTSQIGEPPDRLPAMLRTWASKTKHLNARRHRQLERRLVRLRGRMERPAATFKLGQQVYKMPKRWVGCSPELSTWVVRLLDVIADTRGVTRSDVVREALTYADEWDGLIETVVVCEEPRREICLRIPTEMRELLRRCETRWGLHLQEIVEALCTRYVLQVDNRAHEEIIRERLDVSDTVRGVGSCQGTRLSRHTVQADVSGAGVDV